MRRVRLEIPPSLAGIFEGQGSDWFILEKEIGEEATIRDLLTDLAFSYADFRKAIFEPDTGKVSDEVLVVLNDSLLQFTEVTEAKLNDGDTIILLPVYSGG